MHQASCCLANLLKKYASLDCISQKEQFLVIIGARFLQTGCTSCCRTVSVKALKDIHANLKKSPSGLILS